MNILKVNTVFYTKTGNDLVTLDRPITETMVKELDQFLTEILWTRDAHYSFEHDLRRFMFDRFPMIEAKSLHLEHDYLTGTLKVKILIEDPGEFDQEVSDFIATLGELRCGG